VGLPEINHILTKIFNHKSFIDMFPLHYPLQ